MLEGDKCCGNNKKKMQASKGSHECQVHVGMEQKVAVLKHDLFALLGRWPLDKVLKEVRTLATKTP